MITTRPRGTNDILPEESRRWQYLEQTLREICHQYGYQEIRTPIFEHTELFLRGVGETTDIVSKEMYTFTDKGDRSLTLRPEGTASTVRAFSEHKLYGGPQPTKVYYIGPMFRYDRPQAGRYRQFHQFGVEVFGTDDPALDAEVVALSMDIYQRLGLKNVELHINSVGCPKCRAEHKEALQEYLKAKLDSFCKDCKDRFEKNPMRILDCKNPGCQELSEGAPTTLQTLDSECREHFDKVRQYLDALNLSYLVNERLVRGLDYYRRTAFEIMVSDIGAQSSICGGGRYNGLVQQIGGQDVPGIGFALGMERALLSLEKQGVEIPLLDPCQVYFIALGEDAKVEAFKQLAKIRQLGISAEMDYLGRGMKAQMKSADRLGAKIALILGEDELKENKVTMRNLTNGEQENVLLAELLDVLPQNLK